jgi:hypothetical protein
LTPITLAAISFEPTDPSIIFAAATASFASSDAPTASAAISAATISSENCANVLRIAIVFYSLQPIEVACIFVSLLAD